MAAQDFIQGVFRNWDVVKEIFWGIVKAPFDIIAGLPGFIKLILLILFIIFGIWTVWFVWKNRDLYYIIQN